MSGGPMVGHQDKRHTKPLGRRAGALRALVWLCAAALIAAAAPARADTTVLRLYLDADRTNHPQSAIAIERGIRTALDEVNNRIGPVELELVLLDHRANVLRSKRNYETFLEDPAALVMFAGMHSPPLIRNRDFINQNKALTMVPWAAGGPITRPATPENWIFRVSLDDTRAGGRLIDYALDTVGCAAPHLALESTPWGDSNLASMGARLRERGNDQFEVTRYGMSLRQAGAEILLRRVIQAESDCVLLVSNAEEGASIVNAMAGFDEANRLPVISHWGITGGDFLGAMKDGALEKVDLTFIQTCFSFHQASLSPFEQAALSRAVRLFSDVETADDIDAPAGFNHAYDATRLLIAAARPLDLSRDISVVRHELRRALEALETPTQGLVRLYERPFDAYDPTMRPNAHEALGPEHYCMARYGAGGNILVDSGTTP